MIKYIIALLAIDSDIYAQEAQRSFEGLIDVYVAGSESFPHITLCQFYGEEDITKKIDQDLAELKNLPRIRFNGLQFVKSYLPNLWGAELSIARETKLVNFQQQIVAILKKHNINSFVTEVGDLFRPHLTLARINKLQITHFNENLLNSAKFSLTLGKASKIGQYQETIKIYQAKMTN